MSDLKTSIEVIDLDSTFNLGLSAVFFEGSLIGWEEIPVF